MSKTVITIGLRQAAVYLMQCLIPIVVVAAIDNSAECCGALLSALPGQVSFSNTTAYDDRVSTIWSVTAALHPWCFVLPYDTNDTSIVVKILVAHQCPFGIRGGGHAPFADSNSIHGGVTVDFGYMNTTTYDEDSKSASITPGASWQSVYETLQPHGVTVAGARDGGVGTAGFITGGGSSFYSTSHGWACDNIRNFEVVLGNGTVINANVDANKVLWQALKGGSGNLGLVTRFDVYTIEFPNASNPNIWGGSAQYDLSAAEDVIASYVDFAEKSYLDENSSTSLFWIYSHPTRSLTLQVAMDNTLNIPYPPAFDRYLSTPGLINTSISSAPMPEITAQNDAGQPAGRQNIWATTTFGNDPRVIAYAAERHEALIANTLASQVTNDSGLTSLFSAFPLTQAMIAHGTANGGNAMNLEEKSGGVNGVVFGASLAIDGEDNAALAYPLMKQWVDEVDAYATSLGVNWNWQFLNYAHGAFQEPIANYATDMIRAASLKYDPDQVFQRLRRTGFKIPAVSQ
ncbi:FAD binding domain-containing protein [Hypoxylon sp. FL1284]|nr:FAD binding domain-containing protein [Hypoxylon sp. FL1284]